MPVRTATFGPRDGRVAAASLDAATAAPTVPARATATESQSAASPPPIVIEALVPPAPIEIPPIVVAPIQLTRIQPSPATPPR